MPTGSGVARVSRLPAGVLREATIDVGAITANVRHLRRLTDSEVIAVVKADGYGHGAVRSAVAALEGGASRLGVADIGEALALRRGGHRRADPRVAARPRRLVRRGRRGGHRARHLELRPAAAGCGRGIRRPPRRRAPQARDGAGAQRHRARGLPRRVRRGGAARAHRQAARHRAVQPPLQRLGRGRPRRARARSTRRSGSRHPSGSPRRCATSPRPTRRSRCPRRGSDACASASASTGCRRSRDRTSADLGPAPRDDAARVRSPRCAGCPPGQGVSYGYDYRTERETTLALVPLGYADGVPRQASGAGPVTIGGRAVHASPGASRWTSSSSTSAITRSRSATRPCCSAIRRSALPSADEWADAAGTINYEIVTRIGPRVPRRQVSA